MKLRVVVSIICALAFASACRRKEPPPAATPSVRIGAESIAVASVRGVTSGPMLSGTLQPQQSATLLAETAGTVAFVNGAEGQRVSRGTLLAQIADETASENVQNARTGVQSAQTAVAIARRDQERFTSLANAGAVARRDADVARAQVASAQAQLAQAQTQLTAAQERAGNQRVVASLDGIISQKQVNAGDVVTPGTPLFTIVDLGTLQLEASVPSDAIGALQPGADVDVEVRGYAGQHVRGTITRISPTVDATTGQVRVFVAIDNPQQRLVGGLFAEGRVTTVSRNAVTVPIAAVDETGGAPVVVRINNGVTERVAVQLGIRNEADGYVEVVSGINPGDRVLTGPARTMLAGTKIQG